MVREGYYFGLPPFLLGVISFAGGWWWGVLAGSGFLTLALFAFYFFRNPERTIPSESGLVVSPADGRVVVVTEEACAGRPGKRISIFLAIWNVHVNRAPVAGTITKLEYQPGKFLAAWAERGVARKRAKRLHDGQRARRDCVQADCWLGGPPSGFLEEVG